MPAEGLEWLRRDEILSFEAIARLARVLAALGVSEVRLTGGEPLVRRDLPALVGMLAVIPGIDDLSLTTHGILLRRHAQAQVEAEHGPLVELPAKPSSTARRYAFADGAGELGFVNPVSEPFCSTCDRIRVTADGQLRTCLFSRREWDVKSVLRDGSDDAQIAAFLRHAVRHKELKHRVNEPGFVPASRSMSQSGG